MPQARKAEGGECIIVNGVWELCFLLLCIIHNIKVRSYVYLRGVVTSVL